jgi:tetratricopeptide (TPR) repeat protein
VLFSLAAVYSLSAPWLSQRQLNAAADALAGNRLAAAVAAAKQAHSWDPLSTQALADWAAYVDLQGDPLKAESLFAQEVSLEPESSATWLDLGSFYAYHRSWRNAYDAFDKAWKLDRFGPAGIACGGLDQARHRVFHIWPPTCPQGRPRAASP